MALEVELDEAFAGDTLDRGRRPPDGGARRGPYPKALVIDSVRGYRLVEGAPSPGLLR